MDYEVPLLHFALPPGAPLPDRNSRISCIICAYNEAPRITAVLTAVVGHPLLDEVIVVDDGSSDGTASIVRQFPSARLISLPKNRGKSLAVATGVLAAHNNLLMLLDADLRGLAAAHIAALAAPVLSGEAQISLSLRENSLWIFRALGLDFVSGERVIGKALLSEVLNESRELPRFGIEVFMNRKIIARRCSIAVVRWPDVRHSRKADKQGFWKGSLAESRMIGDLLHSARPPELFTQVLRMLALRTMPRRDQS